MINQNNRLLLLMMFILFAIMVGCDKNNSNDVKQKVAQKENKIDMKDDVLNKGTGEIPQSESGKPLYFEQGEPFVLKTASNTRIWVNVDDIWTESGSNHEDYINNKMDDPGDDVNLTFVKLTLQNRSHRKVSYFEMMPNYNGDISRIRIDPSYPKNNQFTEFDDTIETYLAPEDTVEIIGVAVSTVDDINGGVLIWSDTENVDHPTVVFQTPQSERRDQFGVYDFGEKFYAMDKSEEKQLNATIHSVEIDENPPIDYETDSTFMVIDMEIENTGTDIQKIVNALPQAVIDGEPIGKQMIFDNGKGLVEDPWGDSDIDIDPDEILKGTLYIEVEKDSVSEAQLYYLDNNLLIYPMFAMKLNYNLKDTIE